jgi:hypothetical protein
MAIAIEAAFHGPGATMDNYFKSLEILGTAPEAPHPDPSCLFHWVKDDPSGPIVTDVWKDRAAFDKFIQEKVVPAAQQVGMPAPHIKYIDVANYCTAGS